jgi:hypothetical protein
MSIAGRSWLMELPALTIRRLVVSIVVAGLILTGCAAVAPAGPTPFPSSSTAAQLDFRGSVADTVAGLETDHFSCAVNTVAHASSTIPPGFGPAVYALFTAECRRDAAPDKAVQGTFVTLYGRLADGGLVGLDVRSDRLGSDPSSSAVIPAVLARAFAPEAVALVVSAIRAAGADHPAWIALSPSVQLSTETAPLLFSVSLWGPPVVALHDALVAGPSPSL